MSLSLLYENRCHVLIMIWPRLFLQNTHKIFIYCRPPYPDQYVHYSFTEFYQSINMSGWSTFEVISHYDVLGAIHICTLSTRSNDCPSASKATLMNMDKYFMWIHYERLHNHNKAKHNKTVCIFLGIYCIYKTATRPTTLLYWHGRHGDNLVLVTWWRHQMETFSA